MSGVKKCWSADFKHVTAGLLVLSEAERSLLLRGCCREATTLELPGTLMTDGMKWYRI